MEAKINYTVVGATVLILAAALLSFGLWLSVGFDQKKHSTYAVYLHEAVSGLSEDSPVKFNGVQVGYVSEIQLNRHDPRQVKLLLSIEDGTPITISTSATLITQGLTGTTYVGLSASSSVLTPIEVIPGEKYPIIPARPSLFNQLDKVLKEASTNFADVSKGILRVFDKKNAENIHDLIANLEKVSAVFAQKSAEIDKTLVNVDVFMKNMASVSEGLPRIMSDLRAGIQTIRDTSDVFRAAGEEATQTMRSGKQTLDKISEQTIPPFIQLVHRLDAIAANLEKVSDAMRQNPSVVWRGTKPPAPGPGE